MKRIKETTNLNPESLNNNFDIQDIFVLNLQRAIQATFDITNNIIKEYNLELPVNYKSGFEILKSILINNLQDFESFYTQILEKE